MKFLPNLCQTTNCLKGALFALLLVFLSTYASLYSMSDPVVCIGFTGDVMFGRNGNPYLGQGDFCHPWGSMLKHLRKNDLNIINLETTFTRNNQPAAKKFNFKSDPVYAQALVHGNIEIVNLANNHNSDFGYQGIQDTISTLDKIGIKHVGSGTNSTAAGKPVIITKQGIKIGILGYTDHEKGWRATQTKPGHNYIKIGDKEIIKKDIQRIRPLVDILIATLHWGPNYRRRPTPEFVRFAHALIDLGVDIIHGHSAHVFQAVEIYKKKLILYDTGDFVGDFTYNSELNNNQSFLFVVTATPTCIKSLELIPVIIKNIQVNHADATDATQAVARIKAFSAEHNTSIDQVTLIKH